MTTQVRPPLPRRSRHRLPIAPVALALLLPLLVPAAAPAQTVVYVNQNAPGPAHDGTSWATAYLTVSEGLAAAVSGNEVWVAAGTYVERITLKADVALYGGFAGTETARDQRNWTLNKTILDGNVGGCVVTAPYGATSTTRIDGFTLIHGNDFSGSGIYCSDSSPSITNVTITGCNASYDGGAIPTITPTSTGIPLAAGYTLIALPLEPAAPLDSEGLVLAINGAGGSCTSVIRYAVGQYETHPAGSTEAVFPVVPGEGYFVRCASAGTLTLSGYRFEAATAPLALSAGYTLVGLPVEAVGTYTSESACAEINAQGGSATQLLRYENGQFLTHPLGSTEEVFPLELGVGYFIRCASASTWTVTK